MLSVRDRLGHGSLSKEKRMKKIIDRLVRPMSLQPMFDAKGLLLTVQGEKPADNTVVSLSLQEARLLAYGLLAEAERQT